MSYERMIEEMIDKQSEILGAQAVEVAKGVRGLQIDDGGEVVDITADPVTVVDDLVSAYEDNLGGAAVASLRGVAAGYDDLDLPHSLE